MNVNISPQALELFFQGEHWRALEVYANERITAATKTLTEIDPIKSVDIAKLQEEIRQARKLKEIRGAVEKYINERSKPSSP